MSLADAGQLLTAQYVNYPRAADSARQCHHARTRLVDAADLYRLIADGTGMQSRERLLSEIWGYDFDPRSNVVDVCIRRLRRRLGPQAPIETVRNAGYRTAA